MKGYTETTYCIRIRQILGLRKGAHERLYRDQLLSKIRWKSNYTGHATVNYKSVTSYFGF